MKLHAFDATTFEQFLASIFIVGRTPARLEGFSSIR
jgi:hypothetical protein